MSDASGENQTVRLYFHSGSTIEVRARRWSASVGPHGQIMLSIEESAPNSEILVMSDSSRIEALVVVGSL